jgi:hypothetical protein
VTVASGFSQNTDSFSPLGNGRAVTIPLFFFVCFDNNINGPFIRLLIVLDSYLLYQEPSEKIIYQNPEQ